MTDTATRAAYDAAAALVEVGRLMRRPDEG